MLTPLVLSGPMVRLEPLILDHVDELASAGAENRETYNFTWVPDGPDDALAYVKTALDPQAAGRTMVHVVRAVASGRVIGSTRFLDLEVFEWPAPWPPGAGRGAEPTDDHPPSVLEIGSTWYAASAQRTGANLHAKLLQLRQAFEVWLALRVSFKTDARNRISRTAIERLGATPEGVRRAHSPAIDGTVRDSAYYSITSEEWPVVRDRLIRRLGSGR